MDWNISKTISDFFKSSNGKVATVAQIQKYCEWVILKDIKKKFTHKNSALPFLNRNVATILSNELTKESPRWKRVSNGVYSGINFNHTTTNKETTQENKMSLHKRERRAFSDEFKASVVKSVIDGNKSAAEVMRENKISESQFYTWKKAFRNNVQSFDTKPSNPDNNHPEITAIENAIVEKENQAQELINQANTLREAAKLLKNSH